MIAYTDGSCIGNPGKGGWGVALIKNDVLVSTHFGREEMTTNNRMELKGVISAMELNKDITAIYTDSKYVKNGIEVWIHNWIKNEWMTSSKRPVKNRDLWEKLYILNIKYKPEWKWVKGHSGDKWNDLVDRIAKNEYFI